MKNNYYQIKVKIYMLEIIICEASKFYKISKILDRTRKKYG